MLWTAPSKSAPTRSILLTKAIRGTPYFVGLAPDGFRLRLDSCDAAKYRNGAVEHTQGSLHFRREVYVSRSVNDVRAV